ncbi:MAG: SNF2-related protein [Tepidisphaerales bacterium]
MSTQGSGTSIGLRGRKWQRFLRGPGPMLLDELYVPALGAAVRYDRSCAYFSSSVLAAAARGFAGLIERLISLGDEAPRPAARLVVNEHLETQDVQALMETGDTSKLEDALRRRFKPAKDVLEKQRLAMLAWLVNAGLLEIRVGVMRHGTGIVHAKFGIMYDDAVPGQGDAVVFNGSGNESAAGLTANYEQLEVSTSWEDTERLANFEAEFKALWGDVHPDVHTVSLPEALRLKLIKLAPAEPPTLEPSNALARQKAAMVWKFIVEAPYLPNGEAACDATLMVDLWPHQRSVVEETSQAWPAGRLLCDEVGMGKTIEAIGVLRRLLAGRGVKRALLLAPAGLLKQWQAELREKGALVVPRLEGINLLVWPDDRQQRVDGLAEALRQDILLVSRETARTENNVPILLAASPWDVVLLDEAHAARRAKQVEGEFSSANLLLGLLRRRQFHRRARSIVLLSATPMQTHPWEPWDLLSVLGEGGDWLADFAGVRGYYDTLARIVDGYCDKKTALRAASLAVTDQDFPKLTDGSLSMVDPQELAQDLAFARPSQRPMITQWLRASSPLPRRMHRNTRATLRRYHELGLVGRPPATGRLWTDSSISRISGNEVFTMRSYGTLTVALRNWKVRSPARAL